jgi:hypothetical protein
MSRNVPLGMQCVFAADCIVVVGLARARTRAQRNIVPHDINFRIWNLSRPSSPFSVPTADTLNRRFVARTTRRAVPFFPSFRGGFSFPRGKPEKEREREREREGRGTAIAHAELLTPLLSGLFIPRRRNDAYLNRATRDRDGEINCGGVAAQSPRLPDSSRGNAKSLTSTVIARPRVSRLDVDPDVGGDDVFTAHREKIT